MLEARGFNWRDWNEEGVCTIHYHFADVKKNTNMRDWAPKFFLHCVAWALKKAEGAASFKIDWFAAQQLRLLGDGDVSEKGYVSMAPKVIGHLKYQGEEISDHDAITADFLI